MLYSSLYDTGPRAPADLAEVLLQLHVLGETGPTLSGLNAFNASVIVDRCASNSNFLALVASGVIKFSSDPVGTPPSERFIKLLSPKPGEPLPLLRAWPELREADHFIAAREQILTGRSGNGRLPTTAEERLERVLALLDAIEGTKKNPAPIIREAPYEPLRPIFERHLLKLAKHRFIDDGFLGVLGKVNADPVCTSRSAMYRKIASFTEPESALRDECERFVDSAYHVQVASAFSLPLYVVGESSYAGVLLENASEGDVAVLSGERLAKTSALKFSWANVQHVYAFSKLGDRRPRESVETALEALAGITAATTTKDVRDLHLALKTALKEGIRPLPPLLLTTAAAYLFHGDIAMTLAAGVVATVGNIAMAAGVDIGLTRVEDRLKNARALPKQQEHQELLKGWTSTFSSGRQ